MNLLNESADLKVMPYPEQGMADCKLSAALIAADITLTNKGEETFSIYPYDLTLAMKKKYRETGDEGLDWTSYHSIKRMSPLNGNKIFNGMITLETRGLTLEQKNILIRRCIMNGEAVVGVLKAKKWDYKDGKFVVTTNSKKGGHAFVAKGFNEKGFRCVSPWKYERYDFYIATEDFFDITGGYAYYNFYNK